MFSNLNLTDIVVTLIAVLFTIITHEVAHGLVALWNGDPTAKNAGRLTLNPIPHIDPVGLLCLFLFRFGWARPVPINPNRFHNKRLGLLTTSLAGVTTNFLSALLAAVLLRFVPQNAVFLQSLLISIMTYGVFFCVFNLMPIPPLDGSKVILSFLPPAAQRTVFQYERFTQWLLPILVFTGFFRAIITPLVSRILNGMLSLAFL